ncbi:DUF4132 domain-containing protein [Actinoplanes italicus]|uniref:Uncharacterized protein DUF4132 n=1 Tax=Actinoplanes italicus TaxID=113567 RepID=A0A2T0K1Q3_9ACTN|nr:DUF4132 domain-containing protein [Actinoplanes italicus]PRX16732.1 uncharacterized protein DUF4132 [Actinoplanes italicus]
MRESEDAFVPPAAWARHLHPRRGGASGEPFVADPDARAKTDRILIEQPGGVFGVLHSDATDAAVRVAAGRWLAGEPGAPPAGAAAVAVIKLAARASGPARIAFADMWISERGLRFAVLAAAELSSLVWHDAGIRFLLPGEKRAGRWSELLILLRVRAALAVASQDEFEAAVGPLEAYRAAHAYARAGCSVLVPRRDWVEADVAETVADADGCRALMLLHAARTAEQAAALARLPDPWHLLEDDGLVATLVDGVGPAVAPTLFHWFDQGLAGYIGAGAERWLLSVLAALPGDDVIHGLLARSGSRDVRAALLEATRRFPARAMRILAEEPATHLLRPHVLLHLDLAGQVIPGLSPEAAARVQGLVGYANGVTAAPASAVPPVLADPPWQGRRRAVKPPVVAGLTCTDAATVSWRPGEREEWAGTPGHHHRPPTVGWDELARHVAEGSCDRRDPGLLFSRGPEELARPALLRWLPVNSWDAPASLRIAASRFGTGALPALIKLAEDTPAEFGELLSPFASPDVAVLMADWLARLKSMRRLAHRWLLRHPGEAARALIPAALGKAGTARRQAERALLLLHANGHAERVRSAAAAYGPEAAAGIETLLDTDPLTVLPARMPAVPAWVAPVLLPRVRLRDGSGPLPAEAVLNLVTMLIISRPGEPYAGLGIVREAVEPADLAEFAWGLFELWETAGAGAKESWAFEALALLGDGGTARRLTPLILTWPGQGRNALAVAALGVLAGIGTDEALLYLHRISQRAKSANLRRAAAIRISEVADGLGLSAEQLADRLVPGFGLGSDGSLLLDYGLRRFVVGFDEQLRPFVTGPDGKRLKALPKPGARDDAETAEDAYRRFTVLKKDVRTVAAEQVRRLERAMVDGRRWTGAEFRRMFVDHPLLWHIARRLVWARFDAGGRPVGALRIAEDRSLATVDDELAVVADDDVLGIAHPLQLGEDLPGWAEVFAEYELLQPFPQLERSTFALGEDERPATHLKRFEGVTVTTASVLLLDRRGWRRDEPGQGGVQALFERVAGRGQVLTVHLDPGIVGQVGFHAEQMLASVYLHDGTASHWAQTARQELPLGDLEPVIASEILRDLTDVVAAG